MTRTIKQKLFTIHIPILFNLADSIKQKMDCKVKVCCNKRGSFQNAPHHFPSIIPLPLFYSTPPALGLLVTQVPQDLIKHLSTTRETWIRSLGWEDSPGEGNSYPLQYYRLENPMDRGAWQATVHGVAKSRTRLSDFTFLSFPNLSQLSLGSHLSLCPPSLLSLHH